MRPGGINFQYLSRVFCRMGNQKVQQTVPCGCFQEACVSMRYWMTSRCPSLQAFIMAVSPVSSWPSRRMRRFLCTNTRPVFWLRLDRHLTLEGRRFQTTGSTPGTSTRSILVCELLICTMAVPVSVKRNTPFVRTLAMQSSDRNYSPAPDSVFSKLMPVRFRNIL